MTRHPVASRSSIHAFWTPSLVAYSPPIQSQGATGSIVSPQEVATKVGDLQTKVAVLEDRSSGYLTAADFQKAVGDLKAAIESATKPIGEKVDAINNKVTAIDTDRKHYATKLWVVLGALGASTGLLSFVGQALLKVLSH